MDSLRPSQITILVSGAVLLIGSFMDWTEGANGWEEFGLSTFPALIGVIVAGGLAAKVFGNATLPEPILTLRLNQLFLVLALTAMLIMLGFFMFIDNLDVDKEIGFWLSLLAAIGLFVGTVMEEKAAPAGGATNTPAAPF